MKRIAVLWSGGVDSTYAIWKSLSEGHEVYAYSYIMGIGENKADAEKIARDRLAEIFYKSHPHTFRYIQTGVRLTALEATTSTTHKPCHYIERVVQRSFGEWSAESPQSMGHVVICAHIAGFFYHDEIHIGYVANDDCRPMNEMITAYNALCGLHNHTIAKYIDQKHYFGGNCRDKVAELVFPIHRHVKEIVFDQLPEELLNTTWTCELPELYRESESKTRILPCGECDPCVMRKRFDSTYTKRIVNSQDIMTAVAKEKAVKDIAELKAKNAST